MPFWGSIAQGTEDAQDNYVKREMQKLRLREAQDEEKRQQDVMKNSGALLRAQQALMPPPPQQQAPQPPQPAQSSQPQQPPQQQQPPQMGGMPGIGPFSQQPSPPRQQMPPMGGMPGLPMMSRPSAMPPYEAPKAPPQQPQPQQVPQPPQQGGMGGPGQYSATQLAQTIQKMNPGIDPETVIRLVERNAGLLNVEGRMALAYMKEKLAEKDEERKTTQGDRKLDQGEAKEGRLERGAQGETPLSQSIIDRNKGQANASNARANKAAGGGSAGMKPGKPVVFQGEDGQTYSRVLMSDGSIVVRDSKGHVKEDGVKPKGSAGQETMRRTVELDLSEIDMSLKNMAKDMSQTSSLFFMDHAEKGAFTRWTENKLTPTEKQLYDVYSNRIASAIAGIQSMGRGQVSDEKIKQAQKLVPQPGDDPATIKTKLAYIKGIRDNAASIMQGKKADEIKPETSPEDQAAISWAKANPADPRAKKILELHPGS